MNERRMRSPWLAAVLVLAAAVAGCRSDDNSSADRGVVAGTDGGEPGASGRETAVVEGSIAYRQRIALPKDATVVVRLIDLSRGAAAGGVVAERSFPAQGQVPIRFRLPYDPSRVLSQNAYGIEASILVDGALWFVSDQPVAVLTRGAPADAQVMLRMAPQPG